MWKKTADRLLPIVLSNLTKVFPVLVRNVRNFHSSQVALQYGKGSTEKSEGTPAANEKSDDNASEVDRERISSSNTVSGEKFMTNSLGRYQVYRNEDSEIILDVEEERRKLEFSESSEVDELSGINIKRGISGVFDIHELVDVLRKQKAQDIFVISVPPSYNYVSHMVIATGRSARHLKAIAEFLNKVYKRKKSKPDPYFKIEGLNSNDWMAMDLGNIAVHIFLKSTREVYDLESLWALGAELDYMCKKADDPLITLLKSPINLEDLEPSSTNTPR